MTPAEVSNTVPYWNPEFTTGSITLVIAIVGSVAGASWWFTKLFSRSQVSFAELKINVAALQADITSYKASQDMKLDAVHVELKKQTEILTKQEVMSERILHMAQRQDRLEAQYDKLDEAFSRFRVGSTISAQATIPSRGERSRD